MNSEDEAEYYVDLIHRLLTTRKYEWCRPTLEGISRTIATNRTVSLRQREAVDHIMAGRLKHDA
jgi:hypothetical protein